MRLYGVSVDELKAIVDVVSECKYQGNLKLKDVTPHSRFVTFTLRVKDSKEPGARRSASGRRTPSACWHVHKHVLDAIFDQFPNARLVSALADYRGVESYRESHRETGTRVIGSQMNPVAMIECCDCGV